MVCIPCFIIPAVLFIWYRFIQPILLKFWNPFGKVESSNENKEIKDPAMKCPFSPTTKEESTSTSNKEELTDSSSKKAN